MKCAREGCENEFEQNSQNNRNYCGERECNLIRQRMFGRKSYWKNRDKNRARTKKWYRENPEKARQYTRSRAVQHRAAVRLFFEKHPEKRREYYEKNKNKDIAAYRLRKRLDAKSFRGRHPEYGIAYRNEQRRIKSFAKLRQIFKNNEGKLDAIN